MQAGSSLIALLQSASNVHCDQCGTPVATLIGGALVIRSRHHSEKHVTVLNIFALASALMGL